MVVNTMDPFELLRKHLEESSPDTLRQLVQDFAEILMGADADAICNAAYGEKTLERVNKRNGYRQRRWDTRAGTIDLEIPKLRKGSYFPSWLLEPRRRGEKALIAVVAECYVKGVSTRRVDGLVQTLGIEGISKSQVSEMVKSLDETVEAFRTRPLDSGPYRYLWVDALALKSREIGGPKGKAHISNVATLVATAVNSDGRREILNLDVVTTEDGAGWLQFFRQMVSRGLSDVELVISDSHEGLKAAIAATLPGASWQRCRTHFMRNLLTRVPKSAQEWVATAVRSIFAQPDSESTWAQHAKVVELLSEKFPEASQMLAEAAEDILAFTSFPKEHWRQIWSNNPQERLNKEIRRRSDVVGIFPNREAIIRLVGAVLAEQHDEWQVARRYMSLGSLAKLNTSAVENALDMNGEEVKELTAV
ncbi:MAG: IS256 family transposase, partial [Actinomycetota bacterium]